MAEEGVRVTESAHVERLPATMQQRVDFATDDEVAPAIETVSVTDLPGYDAGYKAGYKDGVMAGYDKGEERGWNRGFDAARKHPPPTPSAAEDDGVFEAHLDGLDCGRTPCLTCGRP